MPHPLKQNTAPAWNGKPVVVYHPDMMCSDGFAGNPTVFNRQKVGTIFNTRFDNKRLKAEAWIDVARVRRVDARVLYAIQNQQMMEVSTGLVFPLNSTSGTFNGKQYQIVARDLQPDHLAILPDMVGACSIVDGAGLVRNETGIVQEGLPLPVWSFG